MAYGLVQGLWLSTVCSALTLRLKYALTKALIKLAVNVSHTEHQTEQAVPPGKPSSPIKLAICPICMRQMVQARIQNDHKMYT